MSYRPLLLLAWALLLAGGCSRKGKQSETPSELRVLCGSSMATPAEILCRRFKTESGSEVVVDLGGSETLLPRILAGAPADIFICHDPFEQKIKETGRWAGSARVGVLEPMLLVRPGNPLKLAALHDLTNRNLKIGIGDPRYSTCGALFVEVLEKKDLRDDVMKQVTLQARTHAELANGLIVGPLDAIVVWNYLASMYAGKVERLHTGVSYPEVHVTVVGLTQSRHPALRDSFLAACRTESTKRLFAEHGYGETPLIVPDQSAREVPVSRPASFRVPPHARFVAPDAAVVFGLVGNAFRVEAPTNLTSQLWLTGLVWVFTPRPFGL